MVLCLALVNNPPSPSEQDSHLAGTGLELLKAKAKEGFRLKLEGHNTSLTLPPSIVSLLERIFTEMAQGKAIDIVALETELTTSQAADVLNVSRPFVTKLLDEGKLPHRKVGSHRRVLLKEVLGYKEQMQQTSKAALNELAELSQKSDTY